MLDKEVSAALALLNELSTMFLTAAALMATVFAVLATVAESPVTVNSELPFVAPERNLPSTAKRRGILHVVLAAHAVLLAKLSFALTPVQIPLLNTVELATFVHPAAVENLNFRLPTKLWFPVVFELPVVLVPPVVPVLPVVLLPVVPPDVVFPDVVPPDVVFPDVVFPEVVPLPVDVPLPVLFDVVPFELLVPADVVPLLELVPLLAFDASRY